MISGDDIEAMKEQRPIIVNIWGAPGVGKSTTAAGLFASLNRDERFNHLNMELVTEVAKDFVWENRMETLEVQLYVTAKQFRNMYRVAKKVDLVITDSPVMQGAFYGEYYEAVPDPDIFFEMLKGFNDTLGDRVDFYLPRSVPYKSVGRNQSEEEIKNFDTQFEEFMRNIAHLKLEKHYSFQDQIRDWLLKNWLNGGLN